MHSLVCTNETRLRLLSVYLMYDLMFFWLAHAAQYVSATSCW